MDSFEPKTWPPPGTTITFNLIEATEHIQKKLSESFVRSHWDYSVRKQLYKIRNGTGRGRPSETSLLCLQLNFVEELWETLFGLTSSPSPWGFLLEAVSRTEVNGKDDEILNPQSLLPDLPATVSVQQIIEAIAKASAVAMSSRLQ
ncbi:hypothetical protein BJ170DRAFT_694318 [Xylariales sp. AK1849]|nr:hypothetical protein BJ170DRAFT_694318 [Xylariales sp. AK1849]